MVDPVRFGVRHCAIRIEASNAVRSEFSEFFRLGIAAIVEVDVCQPELARKTERQSVLTREMPNSIGGKISQPARFQISASVQVYANDRPGFGKMKREANAPLGMGLKEVQDLVQRSKAMRLGIAVLSGFRIADDGSSPTFAVIVREWLETRGPAIFSVTISPDY